MVAKLEWVMLTAYELSIGCQKTLLGEAAQEATCGELGMVKAAVALPKGF